MRVVATFVLFLLVCSGAMGATQISNCVVGDVKNNSGPVRIIFSGDCNVILPAKLGSAEVRFIPPKLIDIRTIKYAPNAKSEDWLSNSAVLSVESMAYEHVNEPAVRARIHVEEVVLRIGSLKMSFRAFQKVELGTNAVGWLGRVGDSGPFSINAGDTKFHTTMFRPLEPLTWRELLKLVKTEKQIRIDLLALVSGGPESPDEKAIISSYCAPSLKLTQKRIAKFRAATGREPARIHIYCDGS